MKDSSLYRKGKSSTIQDKNISSFALFDFDFLPGNFTIRYTINCQQLIHLLMQ